MHRWHELDLDLCVKRNRIGASRVLERACRAARRLGDGAFCYAPMAGLAPSSMQRSLH